MSFDETVPPNWDEFSFEEELQARKLQSQIYMEQLQTEVEEKLPKICPGENNIKKLEGKIFQLKDKQENMEIEYKKLKTDINNVKKKIDDLKKEKSELDHEIQILVESEMGAKEEYKLHKHAYNIALQKFRTHFDLDINIRNISDDIFEANVKFQALSDIKPIKLTINRKERKIIDFDAAAVLTQDELNGLKDSDNILVNIPAFLARIRQHLVSKNILK